MCESSFLYSNQPERAGKQINQNALKQIKAVEKEIIIIFDSLMVLIMRQYCSHFKFNPCTFYSNTFAPMILRETVFEVLM